MTRPAQQLLWAPLLAWMTLGAGASNAGIIWSSALSGEGSPERGAGVGAATGKVGDVAITVKDADDGDIEWLQRMYRPGDLAALNVPSVVTVREEQGHRYTIEFAPPVDNPVVAVSSLGAARPLKRNRFTVTEITTAGGLSITNPRVNVLFQLNFSEFDSSLQDYETDAGTGGSLIGVSFYEAYEGDFVARAAVSGVTSLTFSISEAESYMTFLVGYEDVGTLGGMVKGLSEGESVRLETGSGEEVRLSLNGAFSFNEPIESGAGYDVNIVSHPPGRLCRLSNA